MPIQDFTDLIVWQKAILFAKEIYRLTKAFPRAEEFGLELQVRKAAVSVHSNIAEGHARQRNEFSYFLSISRGSLAEAESQMLFACEVEYLKREDIVTVRSLASEIHKMIASLTAKLETRSP